MNTKNTWIWFMVAAVLFASIYLLNHFVHPPAAVTRNVLPGLDASSVTGIQVIPAGALEIEASRTNGAWTLEKPIAYPAQSAAIEALLDALQKLTAATRITAYEVREHGTGSADYGFDSPQNQILLSAGSQHWQLLIGNKTAPGDQVFLRIVGVDTVFVTDTGWLKLLPHSAADWRSTALVAANSDACDTIVLTNSTKVLELHRDATNHLWRMVRPLQSRADSDRITDALQQLQNAKVAQFVTDDPRVDLSVFGLQPADLDLWFESGTNVLSALHTGRAVTNDVSQVYARREGWSAIFTTARNPLALWHGTVNDFRDPHLLELAGPVSEIEVKGSHDFTLRNGTNGWQIVGAKYPADADSVQEFLKTLAGIRVSEFAKDVVTAPDLTNYGFATPQRLITLRSPAGDSNAVIAQLAFAVQTNGIFVHRADEDFIYAITPDDYGRLPEMGWEFRDRHIWNFGGTNVVQITLHQNGKTRVMVHDGYNKWSLATGSQGMINPPALEETAHRLGELTATGWVGADVTQPEKFGWSPDNLEITIELKGGEKYSVAFGMELPSAHTALAGVMLDGQRWVFVFPPVLYQFVTSYLTIPANVP